MLKLRSLSAVLIVGALLLICASQASAQATRTWVSAEGVEGGAADDANSCSRTSPCKTFAGAISKTAAGGTISVLDTGGYGPVVIGKAISIIAEGAQAGVVTSGNNGITINAGSTDLVHLQGLFIQASK